MKKFILSALAVLCAMQLGAKDYNASLFGIKSNGTTLNTSSIQKAIDYIHSEGGGRLVFYVGRYLTGSINLRSNVTIQLNEGAVLLGSTNPYDYPIDSSYCALVRAVKVDNVPARGSSTARAARRRITCSTRSRKGSSTTRPNTTGPMDRAAHGRSISANAKTSPSMASR